MTSSPTGGDGYKYRIGKGISNQISESVTLSFPALPEDEANELEALVSNIRGIDTLQFRPPYGYYEVEGRVSNVQKSSVSGGGIYTVSFEFQKEFQHRIFDFFSSVEEAKAIFPSEGIVTGDVVALINNGRQELFLPYRQITRTDARFMVTMPRCYITKIEVNALVTGTDNLANDYYVLTNPFVIFINLLITDTLEIYDENYQFLSSVSLYPTGSPIQGADKLIPDLDTTRFEPFDTPREKYIFRVISSQSGNRRRIEIKLFGRQV